MFLGQELAPDGLLLSLPLCCCNGEAVLPCKEQRAIPLPSSGGFVLSLSRGHQSPLWWRQG